MIEAGLTLRQAVLTALSPLTVESVVIPLQDSFLNPNTVLPLYRGARCYVLITDQNESETTGNRCNERQSLSLTIDIITKFPKGSGGKLASEKISEVIQPLITNSLDLGSSFQLLKVDKINALSRIEFGSTEVAFRKVINYSFDVFEL
jgi:hypothetical protein